MFKSLPTKKTAVTVLEKLLSPEDLQYIKKKAQVVLMVGMPGSGKSTISELLVAAYGFWRFSSDQIRVEELFPDQEHRLASEHDRVMGVRQQVYQELSNRVVTAVKRGQSVVVDGTNLDDKRDLLMKAILQVTKPEKIVLISVKTPEGIMTRRFTREGEESAGKWASVYAYWKGYFDEGRARFPVKNEYPGVYLSEVQRYDLETFDWISNIGVIVWDIDQTLYNNVPGVSASIQKFVLSSIKDHLKLTTTQTKTKYDEVYAELGSTTQTLDHLGLDGRRVMEQAFMAVDLEKLLKPDKRLLSLFKNLNQFHHVVLTNADQKSTERKLKALGLPAKLFSAIYTTYDMPYVKPDSRVFQHVIKQTSFAPQQHLYVGDRLKADIIPAKAAGMRTALVWSHSVVPDVSFDEVYQVGRLFGVEV